MALILTPVREVWKRARNDPATGGTMTGPLLVMTVT
jgi:hypothetical protein